MNIKSKLISNIQLNQFFNQEKLEELINAEKSGESFTQMPNAHYMEITNVLLNWFVLLKNFFC